jgi:urease accessory protein UreH
MGLENSVYVGARPVLRESFILEPSLREMASLVRMSGYSHTASFCAVQEGKTPAFWRALEDRLSAIALARSRRGEAEWGASTLASDGVIVRGVAASGRFLHPTLIEFWRVARIALTGEDSAPPRKIY